MLERTSGDHLVQSPCREQGQLEQVYEDYVPLGFEHPQACRLYNHPRQSLLEYLIFMACHPALWGQTGVCARVRSRGVPMTPCQSFLLCLSGFCCISACVCWPVTGHHWQESGSVFLSSQHQIFRDGWNPPSLLFTRLKNPSALSFSPNVYALNQSFQVLR